MKITKDKLKQIIKEELEKRFPVKEAEDLGVETMADIKYNEARRRKHQDVLDFYGDMYRDTYNGVSPGSWLEEKSLEELEELLRQLLDYRRGVDQEEEVSIEPDEDLPGSQPPLTKDDPDYYEDER